MDQKLHPKRKLQVSVRLGNDLKKFLLVLSDNDITIYDLRLLLNQRLESIYHDVKPSDVDHFSVRKVKYGSEFEIDDNELVRDVFDPIDSVYVEAESVSRQEGYNTTTSRPTTPMAETRSARQRAKKLARSRSATNTPRFSPPLPMGSQEPPKHKLSAQLNAIHSHRPQSPALPSSSSSSSSSSSKPTPKDLADESKDSTKPSIQKDQGSGKGKELNTGPTIIKREEGAPQGSRSRNQRRREREAAEQQPKGVDYSSLAESKAKFLGAVAGKVMNTVKEEKKRKPPSTDSEGSDSDGHEKSPIAPTVTPAKKIKLEHAVQGPKSVQHSAKTAATEAKVSLSDFDMADEPDGDTDSDSDDDSNRRPPKAKREEQPGSKTGSTQSAPVVTSIVTAVEIPVKRKPGRPRKVNPEEQQQAAQPTLAISTDSTAVAAEKKPETPANVAAASTDGVVQEKRKPGRPRKVKPEEQQQVKAATDTQSVPEAAAASTSVAATAKSKEQKQETKVADDQSAVATLTNVAVAQEKKKPGRKPKAKPEEQDDVQPTVATEATSTTATTRKKPGPKPKEKPEAQTKPEEQSKPDTPSAPVTPATPATEKRKPGRPRKVKPEDQRQQETNVAETSTQPTAVVEVDPKAKVAKVAEAKTKEQLSTESIKSFSESGSTVTVTSSLTTTRAIVETETTTLTKEIVKETSVSSSSSVSMSSESAQVQRESTPPGSSTDATSTTDHGSDRSDEESEESEDEQPTQAPQVPPVTATPVAITSPVLGKTLPSPKVPASQNEQEKDTSTTSSVRPTPGRASEVWEGPTFYDSDSEPEQPSNRDSEADEHMDEPPTLPPVIVSSRPTRAKSITISPKPPVLKTKADDKSHGISHENLAEEADEEEEEEDEPLVRRTRPMAVSAPVPATATATATALTLPKEEENKKSTTINVDSVQVEDEAESSSSDEESSDDNASDSDDDDSDDDDSDDDDSDDDDSDDDSTSSDSESESEIQSGPVSEDSDKDEDMEVVQVNPRPNGTTATAGTAGAAAGGAGVLDGISSLQGVAATRTQSTPTKSTMTAPSPSVSSSPFQSGPGMFTTLSDISSRNGMPHLKSLTDLTAEKRADKRLGTIGLASSNGARGSMTKAAALAATATVVDESEEESEESASDVDSSDSDQPGKNPPLVKIAGRKRKQAPAPVSSANSKSPVKKKKGAMTALFE